VTADMSRLRETPGVADTHTAMKAGRFEVNVTADSHFGWIRTRLSIERTMMSWLRTAASLIGFGFAIVQFFKGVQQMPGARPPMLRTHRSTWGLRSSRAASWRLLSQLGTTAGRSATSGANRFPQSRE
jgi:uncharacterized membrane protein YidH (DUF202 family)